MAGRWSSSIPAGWRICWQAGEIDVALVPAFEALRRPEFPIVDGVAISSRGAVYSVFLAYRGDLSGVRTVHLDPASRTSNNLLRCLLAEFHGLRPQFETEGRSAEKELDHWRGDVAHRESRHPFPPCGTGRRCAIWTWGGMASANRAAVRLRGVADPARGGRAAAVAEALRA